MAIDTKAKRHAALLDQGTVFPDGTISATDRANLLDHYFEVAGTPREGLVSVGVTLIGTASIPAVRRGDLSAGVTLTSVYTMRAALVRNGNIEVGVTLISAANIAGVGRESIVSAGFTLLGVVTQRYVGAAVLAVGVALIPSARPVSPDNLSPFSGQLLDTGPTTGILLLAGPTSGALVDAQPNSGVLIHDD